MTHQHDQLVADQARLAADRDLANWATMVHRLQVTEVPDGVDNINVDGRRLVGAIQGFGQLWQKTYRIRLEGATVTPAEVIAVWKQQFARFWPAGSRFHSPHGGLTPGVVVLLDQLLPGHLRLSSGVMLLYADAVSFTVMSAEGMPFAGWNTFSAHDEDGVTVAQVQLLMRADDPLFELAMVVFAHRMEDRHWQQTLHNLAAHFGVQAPVRYQTLRLDRRRQWARATNLWYNAAVRSALHLLAARVHPPRPRQYAGPRRLRRGQVPHRASSGMLAPVLSTDVGLAAGWDARGRGWRHEEGLAGMPAPSRPKLA